MKMGDSAGQALGAQRTPRGPLSVIALCPGGLRWKAHAALPAVGTPDRVPPDNLLIGSCGYRRPVPMELWRLVTRFGLRTVPWGWPAEAARPCSKRF